MHYKKIIFAIALLIMLLSMSAVSADENSTDENITSDNVKSVTLTPVKLSTTYGSGKYFKVKAVDSVTKKPADNIDLSVKISTGNRNKIISVKTDSIGIAKYSPSKLSIGKHKITVSVKDKNITSKTKTSSVKITKAKLKIHAPKITSYYKINKKYSLTVKNSESDAVMKGIKVIIKIFTGNKYKKFSLKTNKNGAVSINTKSLKKGTHKVTVTVKESSKTKKASAKTTIKTVDFPKYIKLKINGKTLNVKLANNKATRALVEKLKKEDIKIKANEYGGFEKVGKLGFSLPASDKYIKTEPGDLVLYQGNQISLFYNSNSWEYTELGKVDNTDNLKNILGSGDVELILSLK